MSALTSLLARDRIVPVSKIEEALQHQVLSGGAIETILLEMNLVPEDVLSAYRAALFGLLPATREEVMKASRDAIRLVPRDLARAAGVVPLQYDGRTLVVAAEQPPSEDARARLLQAVRAELTVRIVTPPRLAAAFSHHYGFELDIRFRRLTDALRKREPGTIPYVRPPGPSLRPLEPALSTPFDNRPDTLEYPLLKESLRTSGPAGLALSEPSFEGPDDELAAPAAVPAIIPPAPRRMSEAGAGSFRLSTIPPTSISGAIARAARGPIDAARARELLALSAQRDDALFVWLRYLVQFFDFVAIFSVGKEVATGRMAHGAGLSPELMEHVVFPLGGTGLAARAVRDKRALVGDLSASDEERAAAALLGRPSGRPGIAIPVALGSRVALLAYADRNGEGVSADDVAAVSSIVPDVADALRRIILEQKALRRTPSSAPPAQSLADDAGDTQTTHPPAADVPTEDAPGVEESLPPSASTPPPGLDSEPADPVPSASPPSAPAEPADPEMDLQPAASEPPRAESVRPEGDAGLEAVDLDRVLRLQERRTETERGMPFVTPGPAEPVTAAAREAARGRLSGVPRTAPPPPIRESITPQATGRADGSYHYAAPSGAVLEESVRPQRAQGPGPLGLREVLEPALPVGSALAQVRTRRIELQAEPKELPEAPRIADERGEDEPVLQARETPPEPATEHSVRASLPQPPVSESVSVIIDMGDQVTTLVSSLMDAGPDDELPQIDELLRVGEAALPVLLQYFPGRLWFDRKQPHRRRPRGRDVSAVARAIIAFGADAAPYLASKIQSGDADECFYALMVASEIVHPDLLDSVVKRALDADEELRGVALEVLRGYARLPQFAHVVEALAHLSERPGKDGRRQRFAIEALGELRERRALSVLLPRLSDPSEANVQAAHRALVLLSCQDFGLAQRKWEAWAAQWASGHRIEWLIESLLHADERIRALAGEELKQETQQYFGYHPQLPRRDRELSQRKYREWWEREGRAAFGVG
jgi:hypothetical protein